MSRLIYVVYPHKGTVVSVAVVKETPKRFYVDANSAVTIIGRHYYMPDQLDKESYKHKIFLDLGAARSFLLQKMREEEIKLRDSLEHIRALIAQMEAV